MDGGADTYQTCPPIHNTQWGGGSQLLFKSDSLAIEICPFYAHAELQAQVGFVAQPSLYKVWLLGQFGAASPSDHDRSGVLCAGMRAVRGIGWNLSDHHVILCKVKLVDAWIKRREVMDGARRIRSEKLREYQYIEGYVRSLEGKGVEWDGRRKYSQKKKKKKSVDVFPFLQSFSCA